MNPDDLARFRDELGSKWVLALDPDGPRLYRINNDGSRDGPHTWDDVTSRHQLTRLYPPPEALDLF
ncbi:hypothetical protein ACH4GK_32080 [Streptomyces rimosus]|uniref:hypothetical protein n=1 Tax=Streptomyces rimosus TaxID=1927 RepID=UPI0004CA5E03|nr:hypothetical protein [Streptomyces rimosus]